MRANTGHKLNVHLFLYENTQHSFEQFFDQRLHSCWRVVEKVFEQFRVVFGQFLFNGK